MSTCYACKKKSPILTPRLHVELLCPDCSFVNENSIIVKAALRLLSDESAQGRDHLAALGSLIEIYGNDADRAKLRKVLDAVASETALQAV